MIKKVFILVLLVLTTSLMADDFLTVESCYIDLAENIHITLEFNCDDYLYIIDEQTDDFFYFTQVKDNPSKIIIVPQKNWFSYADEGIRFPLILRRINNKNQYTLTINMKTILSKILQENPKHVEFEVLLNTFYSNTEKEYQTYLIGNNDFKHETISSGEVVLEKKDGQWELSQIKQKEVPIVKVD